jgi:hypothetical protein
MNHPFFVPFDNITTISDIHIYPTYLAFIVRVSKGNNAYQDLEIKMESHNNIVTVRNIIINNT